MGNARAARSLPWRTATDGLRLFVRLTPKAAHDTVGAVGEGPDGPYLAVKVRALPAEGAANAALEKLVAGWLGLARRNVVLVSGAKSRLKTLHLSGDPPELDRMLRETLEIGPA